MVKRSDDIEQIHALFESEVHAAADAYFLIKHIDQIVVAKPEVHRALNANGLAWTTIQYSLRVTSLTVLGRIFDDEGDDESLSVFTYLDLCAQKLPQFSKQALKARKLKNSNTTDEFLLEG